MDAGCPQPDVTLNSKHTVAQTMARMIPGTFYGLVADEYASRPTVTTCILSIVSRPSKGRKPSGREPLSGFTA